MKQSDVFVCYTAKLTENFWVGVFKYCCGHSGHGTLKLISSQ